VRRHRHNCDLTREELRWLRLGRRVASRREALVDRMDNRLLVRGGLGALARELQDAARDRGLDDQQAALALLDALAVLEVAL
jgi:hypothetical protein